MSVGDIQLSSNFQLNSQRPLDSRHVVQDLIARNAMPLIQRYDGLSVYVEANKTEYKLVLGTSDNNLNNNLNWVNVTVIIGTTTISSFINDANYVATGANISVFNNDAGYIVGSTPVSTFPNDAGYITGFNELDPQFNASPAAGIIVADISNWNTAYSWGNHASAGYLTSAPLPPDASEVTKGIAFIATNAEVLAKINDTKIMTSLKVDQAIKNNGAWITATILTGFSTSTTPFRYRLFNNNTVEINGSARADNPALNVVFTLPAGMRPSVRIRLEGIISNNNSHELFIEPNGDIIADSFSTYPTTFSFQIIFGID